jgi:phosphoribosylaminoimidazole carboxylase PurE protein
MNVLVILGSKSDLTITEPGLKILRELGLSHSLRIASAHRTPDLVHDIVRDFDSAKGDVVIAVAGKAAHLPGVVASLTIRPVIGVPVAGSATAGLDSLLSISQMPAGIPVACMGHGEAGFTNACLLAASIVAVGESRGTGEHRLESKLIQYRHAQTESVLADDRVLRRDVGVSGAL